jgi:methionyl-tRNA formyltransferase
MKIGLLISGKLGQTALQYLLDSEHDLVFVFTDSTSTTIVETCKINNIGVFVGNPRKNNYRNFICDKNIDLLISVNYLFIIDKPLIDHANLYSINLHGSLLPKYRGRTPHVWAIINNETKAGVTAHLIDEDCDTGDIVTQIEVPIDINDTGNSLLLKYHESYLSILDKLLITISQNCKLETVPQDNSLATYFGKRVPDDGLINWEWQKERIRNWIRAQSYPYPGAFTFLNGNKIIIDEVHFSDIGFSFDIPNGTIMSEEPITVKTQNGVIILSKIREGKCYCKQGCKFF